MPESVICAVVLRDQTERDGDLVEAKIDGMLVRCDSTLDGYAMRDLTTHWKRRRHGGWGFLEDVQTKVADAIFPHVELLLNRFVDKFRETVARTGANISMFQKALLALEHENRLDDNLQPIRLTERFAEKGKALIDDVSSHVADRRNKIVRHLESFISKESQSKIEAARKRVTQIVGDGTTINQNTVVQSLYRELKQALRDSLGEHLRAEFVAFGQLLLSRAESIYPDVKQELELVIEDRLNAIQSGLTVMNDQQKAKLAQAIGQATAQCSLALKKIVSKHRSDEHSGTSVDDVSIDHLVANGETTRVEFKATLRVNLHTKQPDKKMEHSCLKTIAAFLNSHGGHLIVGINDTGEAMGIEIDQFPSEDKMNLHLVNLLNDRLGPQNMIHVEPRFESFKNKKVLVIQCKPSNLPVYLKDGKSEQFFTRTGAATTELVPSQVQAYIRQRFSAG